MARSTDRDPPRPLVCGTPPLLGRPIEEAPSRPSRRRRMGRRLRAVAVAVVALVITARVSLTAAALLAILLTQWVMRRGRRWRA